MSRQNKFARLTSPPDPSARGRTSVTAKTDGHDPEIGGQGAVKLQKRTEASRPIGKASSKGAGKGRGDRRDMSKTYSGKVRHAARGNTPRADVSTRKR